MAIMLEDGSNLPTYYPGGPSENVNITASSVQSSVLLAALPTGTPIQASSGRLFRLSPTANCRYAIGSNPTATATSTYLAAGVVEPIEVRPGDRIAVISEGTPTGSPTLSITRCTVFARGTGGI